MNGGMNHEINDLGLEREELGLDFGNTTVGGWKIPYEPKALASMITTIRAHNVKRYLAIEGISSGGWRYIKQACEIPDLSAPLASQVIGTFCKELRQPCQPYDLISLDTRNLPITCEEVWKFILGGKEPQAGFGKGAPRDYGPAKLKPGTLIIFNFAGPDCKDLYYKVRGDNKMHQSTFAGMVKWA